MSLFRRLPFKTCAPPYFLHIKNTTIFKSILFDCTQQYSNICTQQCNRNRNRLWVGFPLLEAVGDKSVIHPISVHTLSPDLISKPKSNTEITVNRILSGYTLLKTT